jgi:Ca2+-binding EF-hand superfamily protein
MSAKVNGNHHLNHHNSQTADDMFLIYRDETLFNNKKSIQEVLKKFDKDGDNSLSLSEFEELLKTLFSFNGKPYSISKSFINDCFNYFDSNKVISLLLSYKIICFFS